MSRLVICLLLGTAVLPSQPLSSGDRNYVLSHFHATRKQFLDSIAGLTPAQWRFKPAADRWSVAEVAEHIVLIENLLFDEFRKLMATPEAPARKVERGDDEKVLGWMEDRSRKAKAGAEMEPSGRWRTPEEAAGEFKARRDRTIDYLNTTNESLRRHMSGKTKLDAYQWLLMISAHAGRHVAQINEVKASAGYPN